ncbi:uncharacterized protein LOC130998665 [Salvia miltiorrhiza]|uniref:uncharacterized protein LOC130998665 n=1 Tax=Salvia miltiorrhiza TaxID=226208 RepID=UPI0025AC012D|nr:uncharacterized protein LOC130998665 [Salvia miltiorrhiza]
MTLSSSSSWKAINFGSTMKNSGETRLVVKRNHGKGGTCYLSALSPQDLSEIPEYRVDLPFWNPWDLTASHSCSGGLLSMTSFAGHIYLCNPTTKQFQILPPKEETPETPDGILSLSETRIVGSCVGYDSESDDYRVLRVWEREHRLGIGQPSGKHRTYDLYSLRDDSWKPIPPPECHCRLPTMTPTIIYARDKFYWPTLDQEVMCYDCREESFYLLPSPPNTRGLHLQLVKFYDEDSVGVVLYRSPKVNPETGLAQPDAYFELWKWRDGARCWDRVFNVSLGGWIHGTEGSIYGQFVFVCGAAGPLTDVKQRLVAYDWCKKECKELGIHNYDIGIDFFVMLRATLHCPMEGQSMDPILLIMVILTRTRRPVLITMKSCSGRQISRILKIMDSVSLMKKRRRRRRGRL